MYKDKNDPRDPWAWRNDWSGQARTDYAELWIVIPLIVGLVLVAFSLLVPLFIYLHCRNACPCPGAMRFFERFLRVLHQIGLDKEERRRKLATHHQRQKQTYAQSFANPAFIAANSNFTKQTIMKSAVNYPPRVNRSMRAKSSYSSNKKHLRRSKSCPVKKPIVPKIRL